MGLLQDVGRSIVDNLSATLRKFTAFIFVMYTIGVIVGVTVATHRPEMAEISILVPLVLALLAYINTTVAVILFIGAALFILLL